MYFVPMEIVPDILLYILSGAAVGLAIGLTGVGGGSLMTPLLILFGFPYNVAIGTDLLYAAITKAAGVRAHLRARSVRWDIVALLAGGSIPASLVTTLLLDTLFSDASGYEPILTKSLGIMLILTAAVILYLGIFRPARSPVVTPDHETRRPYTAPVTFIAGLFLGVFVTLSSVGAGAFCAALLLVLHPHLRALTVVGTDIAHAVPLTLIAGLGHLILLGNVDLTLLACLLTGSLPAIHLGTRVAANLPGNVLRHVLALLLLGMGIRFAWY